MRRFVVLFLLFIMTVLPACREQSKEEIFQQGMEFVRAGNYQAAVTLFKDALDKDQNYIDARVQLGIGYLETGKIDKAENELAKARRQSPDNVSISIHLAEIYLKTKRPKQAIELLESLQNSDPDNSEALRLLAESKAMSGEMTSAEDLFRKSLLIRPDSPPTQLGLARLLYVTKRVDEGDRLVSDIIAKHPNNTDAYYLLFKKAINYGGHEDAIAALRNIKTINPEDIFALYTLGMLYLDTGKIEEARQIANDLIARQPNHPAGYRVDGVALYQIGDYEAAYPKLQKSLNGMSDLNGFYFLGLVSYQLGNLEQAISNFQRALDKSPNHQATRLMIAQTFLKQGRIDDCILQVKQVIERDTNNANAHNILGSAYLLQKKYDLAMAEIDTAIQIDPDLAQAHLKKGLFNLAEGKKKEGEIDLVHAVNAAPEILNTRLLLATYYLHQQNYPMALQVLKEGLAITPDSAIIYNMMAAVYFGQNNSQEAIKNLQKAKNLKSEYLAPYFNLANYHISRKEYQAALQEYQAIMQFVPDSLEALLRSAALYEFTGQPDQAELYYSKAKETLSPQGFLALAFFQFRNGQNDAGLLTLKEGYIAEPDNPDLMMSYAERLKSSGQMEEALTVYIHLEETHPGIGKPLLLATHLKKGNLAAAKEIADMAVAENPSSAQGYLLQAAIYDNRGELPLVEKVLIKGIAATDGDLSLRMGLASLYSKRKAYDEALQIYQEILQEKPNLVPILFAKAVIYDLVGNKKQAQYLYEKILGINENYVPAMNNLAFLLLDVYSENKRALELATKGFRIKPEDPSIIDTLGYALLKNGQVEKSLVFLKKAANLIPDNAEVKIHLAMAYKESGRNDDAVSTLASINESNAQADQLKEAKVLLKQLN